MLQHPTLPDPVKRDEVGLAVLAGAVLGAFLVVISSHAVVWLGGQAWFSDGANVIQWASMPPTLAVIIGFLWQRWHGRCAVVGCVRSGEHPVQGTTRKVCTHHHTRDHHELVHDVHLVEGNARLCWGESHGRDS